jgi:hypothetical protein
MKVCFSIRRVRSSVFELSGSPALDVFRGVSLLFVAHHLASLADIADLFGKLPQFNFRADDLLFGRHGVLQSPRRGAAQPRPLRAPPRLLIRRGDQDTAVRLNIS